MGATNGLLWALLSAYGPQGVLVGPPRSACGPQGVIVGLIEVLVIPLECLWAPLEARKVS